MVLEYLDKNSYFGIWGSRRGLEDECPRDLLTNPLDAEKGALRED